MGNWDNHWPCPYCGSYKACQCEAEIEEQRTKEREDEEQREVEARAAYRAKLKEWRASAEVAILGKYAAELHHAGFFRRRALKRQIEREIQSEIERLASLP